MNLWQEWLSLTAMLGLPIRYSDFEVSLEHQNFRDAQDVFDFLRSRSTFPLQDMDEWRSRCLCLKEQMQTQDLQWACPFSDNYPEAFSFLDEPPLYWTFQGTALWRQIPMIAVVGSREPNAQTTAWLNLHLREFCKARQFAILSGGARGVDQYAHAIAIQSKSPTLAVLPAGLLNIYPKSLESWRRAILDSGGAIAAPFAPQQAMGKRHFHYRNKLIVSLAKGVFVAEANRKSGSRMTGQWAIDLHCPVATLPVSPMNYSGLGALDLIFDGAQMIRDHIDLKLWSALWSTPQMLDTQR